MNAKFVSFLQQKLQLVQLNCRAASYEKTSNSQGTFFVCEGLLSVFNVNLPASISNLNKIEKKNSRSWI